MRRTDFARARIAWTTRDGSRGLWRVSAVARRDDGASAWYLASEVMAGDVYGQGMLPLQPAYAYQFATSRDRHVMFREAADAANVHDSEQLHGLSFTDVAIDVPEIEGEAVPFDRLVAQSSWPLTARLSAAGPGGERWTLEFPVNHINLRDQPQAWQVETGPVLVPCELLDIDGATKTSGLQRAFVFFSRADRVDLLAFGPVGDGRRGFAHGARLDRAEVKLFA